jgi:membrane associated rhomboid family serine protease
VIQLLARTAVAIVIVIVGLILLAVGVSVGAWIAVGGLLLGFVFSLIAPPPWALRRRRMRE